MRLSRLYSWTLLVLFFTGASALAYEVAWFRMLSLVFGVSVYAASAVLTAFMGGLALGSWAAGRYAARLDTPAKLLRLFAACQLGAGVYALLTPALFAQLTGLYVWLDGALQPGPGGSAAIRWTLATLALLLPTTLMGATLPALAQALARVAGRRGRDLGGLYAANTLGGVVGALAAGVALIAAIGVSGTLALAGAIDLAAAGAMLALSRRPLFEDRAPEREDRRAARERRKAEPQRAREAGPKPRAGGGRVVVAVAGGRGAALALTAAEERAEPRPLIRADAARIALVGYALSGFAALGYQVVWMRLLAIFSLNAVYSFTIMLATFLAGLAVGGALMARRADRTARPLALFGWLQLAIGGCGVLVLYAFARMPTLLETFTRRDTFAGTIWTELFAAAVTMLLPTLLIGAVFPVAARLTTSAGGGEEPAVARSLGRLYALNTVGAMAGAFAAGFVLIPALGLQRAALALALINLAVGAAALLATPQALAGRLRLGGAAAAALAAALLLPPGVYLGFREGAIPELVYYNEGVDATVAVFEVKSPPLKVSFVNGRNEVPTDAHAMRAFYLLGHLPPLLRPEAERALMVSFGNGVATGALATHPVERIRAVELVAGQVEAAQFYRQENRGVLGDPRLAITIEDGRNYLLRSGERYDIITADATHPINSSSWALFTREFYTLVRGRLAEDGVFVQWLPFHDLSQDDYRAIIRTFQSVFPHTTLWYTGGTHSFLVATPGPLTHADAEALGARLAGTAAEADLGGAAALASDMLMDAGQVAAYAGQGPVATDDQAFFIPARDMDAILESFRPYLR